MKFLCLLLTIPCIAWSNNYVSELHPYVDCEISFAGIKYFLDAKIYYLDGEIKYFKGESHYRESKTKLETYHDVKKLVDQINCVEKNALNHFIEDRKLRSLKEMFKYQPEFDFYRGMIAAYEDIQSEFIKD